MGRQFAKQAEAKLGVAMPVTNLAGASGDLGLARVAASPADGYVVGQVIALTVTAWAAGVGTPRLDGLEYVALMQNSPSMLFVSKNSPLKSFADFVAEAKARPGSIDVATSGVGTPDDITLRYLAANGITTVAIPFGKPGERYASTVGGHTDAIYEEPGDVVGFLQSGDLRRSSCSTRSGTRPSRTCRPRASSGSRSATCRTSAPSRSRPARRRSGWRSCGPWPARSWPAPSGRRSAPAPTPAPTRWRRPR
jgi:tripartite-type tricarboxylate transporter receptor subunit TctC